MSGSVSADRGPGRGGRRQVRTGVVLVLALLVAAGVVYAGLRDSGPGGARAAPTPAATPTPLADLDLSDLPVPRRSFCAALEQDAIETALRGPVTRTEHYDSGDRALLATGLTDIAHEYNCGYASATGARARAWVFAEPVGTPVARNLVRDAAGVPGCAPVSDGPRFGAPSVGTVCRTAQPVTTAVTLRGLFGDAWLSCQLTTPGTAGASATVRRAERWCARVASTVGAGP
jgi:hypothetical protein